MPLLKSGPLGTLLAARARQRGAGMVELMVGLLIGLIVIAVVYNILSVAEGYKRTTVGASDAQITGMLTQFVAGRDAGNGGAGISMSYGSIAVPDDMALCTRTDVGGGGTSIVPLANDALQVAMRPIPLLITDGGAAGVSDTFISYSTGSSHVAWPVDVVGAIAPAGGPVVVQSPNGFTVPVPTAAAWYWAVIMANDASGRCKVVKVNTAVPDPVLPPTGKVTLTLDATATTNMPYTLAGPARLLNLGPDGMATRVRYDVDQPNAVLRTTNLLTTNALVTNPIAQNIVLMKAQYGVDTDNNGIVDCWTSAVSPGCGGDFTDTAVRAMPMAQLARILAVRIGVVVRSDEPDLRLLTNPTNTVLQAESLALLAATRPPVVLFNCSANNDPPCQNRIVVPMASGAPPGAATCAPAAICDYWRYRTYETVIPLRNAIYNATVPPSP